MTKKVTSIVAASIVLFFASLFIIAAPGPGDTMKHAGFGLHMAERCLLRAELLLKFKDEIGLTPDQVAKIEKMNELFGEASIKQEAEIKIQALKLHSLMQKDPVDRKAAEKMIRDISKLKTDLQIDRMNYLMDVKSLLTPGQINKIEELKKQKRHEMMRQRGNFFKERIKERVKEHKRQGQGAEKEN